MSTDERDNALISAVIEGDAEAFATLVQRYQPALVAVCCRMIDDQGLAHDAAQEAILQAFLNLDRLRNTEQFGAWLCGIGRNICRRFLYDRANNVWSWEMLYGRSHVPEPVDQRPGPTDVIEAAERIDQVRRAIATLPPGQRLAVQSFYLGDLTHAETATALGVHVGTVKTRLHNARQTLRQKLAHIWEGEIMEADDVFVQMRVVDVRSELNKRYLVILDEVGGARQLTFWSGAPQGVTLAMLLQRATLLPVPPTPMMIANLLQAANGKVREVRVTKMLDEVIYAEVHIDLPSGAARIDATWGDAVSLAVVVDAPIRVAASVIAIAEVQDNHYADKVAFLKNAETRGAAEIVAAIQAEHQAELEVIRQTAENLRLPSA